MGFYRNMRIVEKLYSYYRLREAKRFYQKHSIKMDPQQKYIFYAIHFEPEASTGVIADLQNQLTIIQILHQALPKDWLLYLKEHPHQYDINNILDHYYLTNIEFFKDIRFYEEILKLKNARLIDLHTPSKELITHSYATATINGSIILESLLSQKHCITFDNRIMAITQRQFNLIHSFQNFKALREFIHSLQKEGERPIDADLEDLAQYYFDHSSNNKNQNIIQSIFNHLQLEGLAQCKI